MATGVNAAAWSASFLFRGRGIWCMQAVQARSKGEAFGSGFMRGIYSEIYRKHKGEDSPELAKNNARKMLRALASSLPEGSNYLGIGAGSGFTEAGMGYAFKKFGSVTILDIAKRRPKMSAKRGHGNVLNVEADAQVLPIKPDSMDLVSCLMSQDFYADRDVASREMFRVMKPGAHAVVFLHHPEMMRRNLGGGRLETAQAAFTAHLLEKQRLFADKEALKSHYSRHGFKVESVHEHVPGKLEPKGDYWWEVVLRKPEAVKGR